MNNHNVPDAVAPTLDAEAKRGIDLMREQITTLNEWVDGTFISAPLTKEEADKLLTAITRLSSVIVSYIAHHLQPSGVSILVNGFCNEIAQAVILTSVGNGKDEVAH